jgi:hypothetical protein
LHAAEQQRPDVKAQRDTWLDTLTELCGGDFSRVIFLDEMDNLSAHKRPQIKQVIQAKGASVQYLPPYSPDFNPIEMIWSKVKRLLRSIAARTIDALHHAFGQALDAVTPGDILGCFRHCGYATSEGAPL